MASLGSLTTSTRGARAAQFRWDTSDMDRADIMRFDQATINRIKLRLRELVTEMRHAAQSEANARWHDHPDLHPSPHYPSSRTAREGLFAYISGKRMLTVGLSHGPSTIWVGTESGNRFNYGIALELSELGTINRTLDQFADRYMQACYQALNDTTPAVADMVDGL